MNREECIALDHSLRGLRRDLFASGLRAHVATKSVFRRPGPLPPPPFFTGRFGSMHILGNARNHYG